MAVGARHRANPGRVAAARALLAVEGGAHIEDALAELAPAKGPDRALAWFLALGALRRRGEVDAALRPHLRQPLGGLDAEVRAALRIGAFDKIWARSKRHAAVHQGVEVARALGAGRASGLVNAVLRRTEPATDLQRADALNHPAWLLARWDARYGADATEAWCRDASELPRIVASTRDDAAREALLAAGAEPVELLGRVLPRAACLRPGRGLVSDRPGFAEGAWWVQDPAAIAVTDLVLRDLPAAASVLDACAAPGGKTLRLATGGAVVTAVDRSERRLGLVADALARVGCAATLRSWDWSQGPCADLGCFDAVLVDAPCSALGTTRRHPDVRWRRQEPDLAVLAERQEAILTAAAEHTSPGGALVYAVCSPEPEEGLEIVERFCQADRRFALVDALSTAPPERGEDAHFAARMVRSGS